MADKVELLSEVLQVESMSQQVCELSRRTEELQQSIKMRLQSLEDANKVQCPQQTYALIIPHVRCIMEYLFTSLDYGSSGV